MVTVSSSPESEELKHFNLLPSEPVELQSSGYELPCALHLKRLFAD